MQQSNFATFSLCVQPVHHGPFSRESGQIDMLKKQAETDSKV